MSVYILFRDIIGKVTGHHFVSKSIVLSKLLFNKLLDASSNRVEAWGA